MADLFVYRAEPPASLAGNDIVTLVKAQAVAGLNVVTPGAPVQPDAIKADPHGALTDLSAALKTALAAGDSPVKIAMPLPDSLGLDPMLLGGLIGNLITEGARIIEFDARPYIDPDSDASNDGFTLGGLQRPDGFRIGMQMGALTGWPAERIATVAEELQADRYTFAIAQGDDLSKLSSVPEQAMIVLGLVDPDGGSSDADVLALIDAAAEIVDQDRLALTTSAAITDADAQERVLRQVADISTQFWGFAI
jgi:hypothetical protein|tara:strand:- start:15688 stop:16440 length:753 start_codon:yes stop_codon:yes gene_type:complete